MRTTKSQSSALPSSCKKQRLCVLNVALCSLLLPMMLGPAIALAASGDEPQEKPRNVVPVFRLEGQITEVPEEESFPLFNVPGASLKELVARLAKAADDSAVKAVVILPESAELGQAQIEEIRAPLALLRKHGKEVYVYADSLMMGQYVLACGASRISVVPTG